MFIAAWYIILKNKLTWPSIIEFIKLWTIHITKHCMAMKMKKILIYTKNIDSSHKNNASEMDMLVLHGNMILWISDM